MHPAHLLVILSVLLAKIVSATSSINYGRRHARVVVVFSGVGAGIV